VVPNQQTRCLRTDNKITTPQLHQNTGAPTCCNHKFPTTTPTGRHGAEQGLRRS